MRNYAIGDIHGHLALLEEAHALIAADRALTNDQVAPIVHVGDLVDRGPNAKGVIAYLAQGMAQGAPWVVLKGNHDRMFSLFLDDFKARDPRLRAELSYLHPRIGGGTTLASYGILNGADRPIAPCMPKPSPPCPKRTAPFWPPAPASSSAARWSLSMQACSLAQRLRRKAKMTLYGSASPFYLTRVIMAIWWCMGTRRLRPRSIMETASI